MRDDKEAQSLRVWRDAAGLSQSELATQARVAQSVISDIETDKLLPNVAIALRLARALGVTVEQITWRDDTLHHRTKPSAEQRTTSSDNA